MQQPIFIHLVADYGPGDPAFNEVAQKLYSLLPNAKVIPTSVPAFNTLATGFWVYQYALSPAPLKMFIYGNTAPRKDRLKSRKQNAGEKLVYARLKNGAEIMAVNAGYCFSFVKPHLQILRAVKVKNSGSQFRSRDFFPQAVADHLQGKDVLGAKLNPMTIPEVPGRKIAWIDGYGNLKTTIRSSSLSLNPGSKVKIKINKVQKTALVSDGIFSIPAGKLAFSPGSSGHSDRFYEISLRGGSAARLFRFPANGSSVRLS